MKQLLILLVCNLSILLLTGCQNSSVNPVPVNKSGVEVIIEGDGQFPEFLVGTWKADQAGWELVFEPDGTVSSAVIPLGRTRVKPGQTTVVPMKLGGEGVYKSGNWTVQYSTDSHELAVVIVIDSFYVEMGPNVVKGSIREYLVGRVKEDTKVWKADWISDPKYVVNTEKHKDHELPIDPYYNEAISLVFEKVTEK